MIYIFITLFFPIFLAVPWGNLNFSTRIKPTTSAVGVLSHNHWPPWSVIFLIFKDSSGLLKGTGFLTVNKSNSTWHIAFIFFLNFNIYIFPACFLLKWEDEKWGKERAYLPYACRSMQNSERIGCSEAEHKHGTQIQSLQLMCSVIQLEIQLHERIINWQLNT